MESKKLFCAQCMKKRKCSRFWTGQWQCEKCDFFIGSATIEEMYGSVAEYRAERRDTWLFVLQPIFILFGLLVVVAVILTLISS